MASKRWTYVLVAALTVTLASSAVLHAPDLRAFTHGDRDRASVLAVLWLLALIVALLAAAAALRSFLAAHRELHRNTQVVAADAATSLDWLWESDPSHVFTFSSDGVEDLLGYRAEEVVGVLATDLLFEDTDREAARRVAQASATEGIGWENLPFAWRHRDGSRVMLQGSAVAIHDRKGRIAGYRGTRRRVSEATQAPALRNAMRQRVSEVVDHVQVDVALQPIVSLLSGRLVGAEALARFRDGRSPDLWFEEARTCGLRRQLDEVTFLRALATFEHLPAPTSLSINAGPDLILDPGFRERLIGSGAPLDRLVVEVTEHAQVSDYTALNSAIHMLRAHGMRFAVDDAGAGYASLNHVLQLRPDVVKIDRALIADLGEDPARRSLVTALVLLALELGATVTGEGAETTVQLQTLATLGVDHVQGFVLAAPTTDRTVWRTWADRPWIDPVAIEPLMASDA